MGLIYLIGEKIGLPLERDFKPEFLGKSREWMDHERHPLVVDWPDDETAARTFLKQGAFPLTGGIFEFLAALGYRDDEYPEGKPLHMILLADESVSPTKGEIILNRNRWFWEMTDGIERSKRRRWEDSEYENQIIGVHNFLKACALRGISQNPTNNEQKLIQQAREFVRSRVFDQQPRDTNPYRELGYYDVHDGEHFYGRHQFAKRVFRRFGKQLAAPKSRATCRITGYSGSGKSSVLRAGILRELDNATHRGLYRWADFRPEMFKNQVGADIDVIETLLDRLETRAGISLSIKQRRNIHRAGSMAPIEAAEALITEFRKNTTGSKYLILALDQFEEIVDELESPRRKEYWHPLLRFLESISEYPEFGLIYTLESSRTKDRELSEPFKSAVSQEVDDATDTFVDEVITRPFARTGYPLADDVVTELKDQFSKLREEDNRAARNSVLPLLALKLHDLWEFVSSHLEPSQKIVGDEIGMAPSDEKINKDQLEEYGHELDFTSVINDLANKAWQRAGEKKVEEDQLNFFLQPLVGVEGKRVQLTPAPLGAPYHHEQKLIESFLRHRLLVKVGDDLVRLVHQAVIDHWEKASEWLEHSRSFLEREARMRIEAADWKNKGCKRIAFRGRNLEQKIATATEILATYLRAWSFNETDVNPQDRSLRNYCITIFRKSTTPQAPILLNGNERRSHVYYAASYGLTDLLERFVKQDPECVNFIAASDNEFRRPLEAASWAHPEATKLLLRHGADPTTKTEEDPKTGKTNYSWPAVEGGHPDGANRHLRPSDENCPRADP